VDRPVTALTVPSYAKINLGLEVLGVREDGYHELRTIFQTVDLHDDVVIRPRKQGVSVRCAHPGVPNDLTNLAARAAIALQRYARLGRGVAITIEKRIPVGGGLGGGSSNAASVLLALDALWGLGLGVAGLAPIARRLGADVPFFLFGGTALGIARGDEIYPLAGQVRASCVIVDPGRPVSTAAVFKQVDATLTHRENGSRISGFVMRDWGGGAGYSLLSNDLETAALDVAPGLEEQVRRIRSLLVREGAVQASLSGSGSSYYGLFDEARQARRARLALVAEGFAAVVCRTLPLGQYRAAWKRSLAAGGTGGPARARSGHHGDHGRQSHPRRRREAQGVRIDRA
jgi:4-diphosphocytidyl-2-C-methyl-D-erythritol kinase